MSATDSYQDAAKRIWRHATGTPPDRVALLRELARYATLAPNGHNTQPWKFQLQENTVDILPDYARRTPVVDPDDHHLWVSLGCAAENLAQAAPAFGFRSSSVEVSDHGVHVTLTPAPVERTPMFNAIPLRQSTRAVYDGKPLTQDELHQLELAAKDDHVQTVLLTGRQQINKVRDLVIAGNTKQIGDAAFVSELKAWIRFSKDEAIERGDGLFAGASGNMVVPRWLGSLMFPLFFTASSENEKYAKQMNSSAGVAVFAASRPNPAGWAMAGRACERFLLQAAALNIRTAFVNQPVEVATLRPQLAAEVGLGKLRPDLVVRFGHGSLLPASLRRPLDAVIAV